MEKGKAYRIRMDARASYGDSQVRLFWAEPERDLEGEAIDAAEQADAVILFLGLSPRVEGEEMSIAIDGFFRGDRTQIDLPASQQRLLERVTALGKPTVLVLINGSPLAINWADKHLPAILEAWYPGQAAGTAIADVLFGDYNPAGRLPATFYRNIDDLPPFEDYSMKGRTYRFYDGEVLYPFGHGLSYTTFEYTNLSSSSNALQEGEEMLVSVDVKNTGNHAGDEVIQLYIRYPNSKIVRPRMELKGFTRIKIDAGETQTIQLPLRANELRYWDDKKNWWAMEFEPIEILIGASSEDIRQKIIIDVVK